MKYKFIKMQGCGNDYIYFDCLSDCLSDRSEELLTDPHALSVRLSDRHFGVGGDGLVLMLPSQKADARMRMFNADGSEGQICGNAIRCVGKYLYESGVVPKEDITIETPSGSKTLHLTIENERVPLVRVDMGAAELQAEKIPTLLTGHSVVNRPLVVEGVTYAVTCVSLGNPHAVVFMENISELKLPEIGPAFENHPVFPARTNTEFVRVVDSHTLDMRVWERGSGETLACGTGACAAAVAAVLNDFCRAGEDITVNLRGGRLTIRYTAETVFMTGGCETVFEGVIDVG
jgi:carbamoyl-phosphate synthase large subunit